MSKLKVLIRVAICVAIQIVLARFLAINTPVLRISFEFIPLALVAMLYGPWWSLGAAVAADLLRSLIFPVGGFFPGFTLSAALTGLVFGAFLYPCRKDWRHILAPVLISTLVINIGLGTWWLTFLLDKGFLVMLPGRVVKNVVMIPVEFLVIRWMASWAPRLDQLGRE